MRVTLSSSSLCHSHRANNAFPRTSHRHLWPITSAKHQSIVVDLHYIWFQIPSLPFSLPVHSLLSYSGKRCRPSSSHFVSSPPINHYLKNNTFIALLRFTINSFLFSLRFSLSHIRFLCFLPSFLFFFCFETFSTN